MIKCLIKRAAAALGFEITHRPRYASEMDRPSTIDAFHEQRRLLRSVGEPIIFDVGAHVGETAKRYAELFPSSQIYSFEPFPVSFTKLEAAINGSGRMTAKQLALGRTTTTASLRVNRSFATNSLLATDPRAPEIWGPGLVDTVAALQVSVTTLDDFMALHPRISGIDILKLDVQGSEADVLRGGAGTLGFGKIGLIYTEILIAPTYDRQGTFEELLRLTREAGFILHNLYTPLYSQRGRLAQVDALFVNEKYLSARAMPSHAG